MPRIRFRDDPASADLRSLTEDSILRIVAAGSGRVLTTSVDAGQDHPAGGCHMGDNAATSVVDSFGCTHDHENLFVVVAPTMVNAGCANDTLTFAALSLRSAAEMAGALPSRG